MKQPKIEVFDDVALAEGIYVPATHTVTLGYNGEWRELDLSDASFDELEDLLSPYLKMGVVLNASPVKSGKRGGRRDVTRKPGKYYEGMRAYGDKHGLHYSQSSDGKYYYSQKLREQYAKYAAMQGS